MVSKGNHPQMAELFRLVNYYNLPRYIHDIGIYRLYSWNDVYIYIYLPRFIVSSLLTTEFHSPAETGLFGTGDFSPIACARKGPLVVLYQ